MHYIIIGNGIAGTEAAKSIRQNDKTGEITIISKSKNLFFYRPRLINYVSNEVTIEQITTLKQDFYEKNKIKNVLNETVIDIDDEKQVVSTLSNKKFKYDKLLLATGARPFVPQISGVEKEGVFTLREIPDADKIKSYCKNKKNIIIIGGGLLGIEVANSLLKTNAKITIIEFSKFLLPRQLDSEGAEILTNLLKQKGLFFKLGCSTTKINGNKSVESVSINTGEDLIADAVIVSVGVRPRLELAKKTKIETDKAVVISDYMETSVKNIYAAGDIIEHKNICYGLWMPAKEQGFIAGKNMSGQKTKYFGSKIETSMKVTGISLFSTGNINEKNVEIRTVKEDNIYKKIIFKDNILYGAISIGDKKFASILSKVFNRKLDLKDTLKSCNFY